MSNYDNTNSGTLFKNDRKEKDNHPDYKGQINVDGTDYWLSAWVKVSKDGTKKFMSLSVQAKDGAPSKKPTKAAEPDFPEDDPLPF
jgi:uncharacterized protein (DUF736 family)